MSAPAPGTRRGRHRTPWATAIGVTVGATLLACPWAGAAGGAGELATRLTLEMTAALRQVPIAGVAPPPPELASPAALCAYLASSHSSVIDVGEAVFSRLEAGAASREAGGAWEHHESERFLFRFVPGSPAAADRELIAAEAEAAFRSLVELLAAAPAVATNAALLANEKPDGDGSSGQRTGKIIVTLHPRKQGTELTRGLGATRLGGALLKGDGGAATARVTLSCEVVYYNALSLAVLYHEVAHAAVLLATLDAAPLVTVRAPAELKAAFLKAYRDLPPFVREGLADWVVYYRGYYQRWGALPPPEALVGELIDGAKLRPLHRLIADTKQPSGMGHKEYSLLAASFTEHVRAIDGGERLRRWIAQRDAPPVRALESAVGTPVDRIEAGWLAAVRVARRDCPAAPPSSVGASADPGSERGHSP